MIDLKHEIKRELSQLDPPDLWHRIQAEAADTFDAPVLDLTTLRQQRRSSLWIAVAAVTVLLALIGALALVEDDQTVDTKPVNEVPTPISIPGWPGAVRDPGDVVRSMPDMTYQDPLDSAEPWADVVSVRYSDLSAGTWNFVLAGTDPFDPESGLVVAYGLVLDADGDGAPDYLVGIDNDGPTGNPRAWVTDLHTGETKLRDEPPYGVPVEFSHPSELSFAGYTGLTFLLGTAPRGVSAATVNFYAWASAARDGVVVAHDFAPDTGWVSADGR